MCLLAEASPPEATLLLRRCLVPMSGRALVAVTVGLLLRTSEAACLAEPSLPDEALGGLDARVAPLLLVALEAMALPAEDASLMGAEVLSAGVLLVFTVAFGAAVFGAATLGITAWDAMTFG